MYRTIPKHLPSIPSIQSLFHFLTNFFSQIPMKKLGGYCSHFTQKETEVQGHSRSSVWISWLLNLGFPNFEAFTGCCLSASWFFFWLLNLDSPVCTQHSFILSKCELWTQKGKRSVYSLPAILSSCLPLSPTPPPRSGSSPYSLPEGLKDCPLVAACTSHSLNSFSMYSSYLKSLLTILYATQFEYMKLFLSNGL